MKNISASYSAKTCHGALLTSAVIMLQAASVFVPALGLLFGAACIVFVAVAAVLLKWRAVLVYLCAGFLMLALSPRYALEFLLTTGFAGLALGLFSDKPWLSLLLAGLGMFSGLCALTYLLGTAAFGGLYSDLPAAATLPVYAVFSAAYPAYGLYLLQRVMRKRVFMHCC